ncbi:hypothetical protein HHX47_DHR6000295 [Lentinula edodes]|nr:hypothetical protein HHX47_DHR6000295 [Lentinula edodes]
MGKIINDEPRNQVIAGRSIHQKHRWEIKVLTQISLCKSQPLLATADVVIAVMIINEFANLHQFDDSVITWLASSAVTDILITVTLVWILARNPEAGIITTGVYELDMGNQWAQTESAPSKMDDENALVKIGSAQGGRDLGSGVMVRTVVDMLMDPVPMPK